MENYTVAVDNSDEYLVSVVEGDSYTITESGLGGIDGLTAYEIWINLGNIGTEQDFIDSLQGAQGPAGIDGAIGAQGIQGIQGIQGADGADGAAGVAGAKGDTGADGSQGIQGIPGAKGDQGIQGVPGDKGDQGDQGIQGDTGAAGIDGTDGIDGIDGTDATLPATVADGNVLTVVSGAWESAAPTATQIQSDWNQATNTALDYIKNKPSIPSIAGLLDEAAHDALNHTGLTGVLAIGTTDTTAMAGNKTASDIGGLAASAFTDAAVTGKVLTGFSSGAGTVTATDSILSAINKIMGLLNGFQTIATSGGTTSLTVTSPRYIIFTGTQNHTVQLPNATTLALGRPYMIDNDSTQTIGVKDGGANDIFSIAPGCDLYLTCSSIATAAGAWEKDYSAAKAASGKNLTISNSLTLAGTDSTTMTFPSTSQSLVGIKSGALASGSANDLGSSTITTTGAVNTGVISAILSTNSIITRPSVIINNGGIAVGVGVGQAFKLTNWNGSVAGLYVGSAIDSLTTSAQTGAESANLSIKTMAEGSLGERLLVSSTGLAVRPTTASTSTTTGALTIAGGVGIAGTLNVASYIGAGPGFTAGSLHQLYGNTTSAVVNIINTNATSARGLVIQFTSLSSGTSANYYLYCGDTSGAKAEIRADGSGYFAGALEVPSIKITTGAGANKVLTSDAAGAATWQAVGGAIVQALGTKDTNYTCDFNSGRFATVTTGSGAATITIPDWASATVSVDAWLYITQGATARVQTLGAASGINNNIISSDGLMSAGDALPNSGASTTDAFQFTWTGTKWMVTNALFDVKA